MPARRAITAVATVGTVLATAFVSPSTAAAATGTFYLNQHAAYTNPPDDKCLPLDWIKGEVMRNKTDRSAMIYDQQECPKGHLVAAIRRGDQRTANYTAQGSVIFVEPPRQVQG